MPINANSANPRPEGAKLIGFNHSPPPPQLIDHHTLFLSIINPNLGPVGLQITTMALIMILGTSHSTQEVKKIGLG